MNQKVIENIKEIICEIVKKLHKEFGKKLPDGVSVVPYGGGVQDISMPSIPAKDEIRLFPPKNKEFGDLSANVAFLLIANNLFKSPIKSPIELAEKIVKELNKKEYRERGGYERTEVAGKGYINFFLGSHVVENTLTEILQKKENYGGSDYGKGEKVLIEFVSANPTGPLTLAHGRQAAVGDVLANILQFTGYTVTREYYLNDRGRQMDILAESVYLRYLEELGEEIVFPEEGYKGDYITDIAREIKVTKKDLWKDRSHLAQFKKYAHEFILRSIKEDLAFFGVHFDNYFSEKKLVSSGKVETCLELLKKKKVVCQREGALWFDSTQFGDDKDRVLIKTSGEMTYITPDLAYHKDKFIRGNARLINLWGPDHHGYIPRLQAGIQALGYDQDKLTVILVQLCTLYQGKKKLSMSTRKGEFITLHEVIDLVGKDAARYFFNARKTNSHLNFDIELAKKKTADNPVYYIQYAHARICSVYKKLALKGYKIGEFQVGKVMFDTIYGEEENTLIKKLGEFEEIIRQSATSYEPTRLCDYLYQTAQLFHQFYNKHRIVTRNKNVTEARVLLINGVKLVIGNGLRLLGISAPEKM
ncbi:arginine--tRNA ligase [Chlamydiota bacterium]